VLPAIAMLGMIVEGSELRPQRGCVQSLLISRVGETSPIR